MSTCSPRELALAERLSRHPRLQPRIEEILRMAEAEGTDPIRADAAEQQALEEVRRLGHAVLGEWAQRRMESCDAEQRSQQTAVRSGQKNSIGTVPSAPFT